MDYSDERINYDDILKDELSKIFPIFRWTNPAKIFTIAVLLLSTLIPVGRAIYYAIRMGGYYQQIEILAAVLALAAEAVWFWFIYKLYTLDRMDIFWFLFFGGILLDIFFSRNYVAAGFKVWLAIAVFRTKKAEEEANRIHRNLSEARRYSQEKEMRKKLADPETYRNSGETSAAPIDNSNLFGNNSEETIDNFNEPIDLSRIFAKPNSEK